MNVAFFQSEFFWEAVCFDLFVVVIYKPTKKVVCEYLDQYTLDISKRISEAEAIIKEANKVYNYYTKQTKMLDEQVDLPMIIFQYPDPSGCAYSIPALVKAATLKNVVGLKAACGTVTRYVQLWEALHDKISVLAALDSPPLLGMILHGVHGALIGIGVINTPKWVELIAAAMDNDAATATQIHRDFCIPIMDGVFENQEPSSPTSEVACVKAALVQLGQIPNSLVRHPAVNVTDLHRAHVKHALIAAGLLT